MKSGYLFGTLFRPPRARIINNPATHSTDSTFTSSRDPARRRTVPARITKKDTSIMVSNRLTEAFPDWAWKFAQAEAAAAIPAAEAQLYAL